MRETATQFLLIDAGNTRVKWAVGGRRGLPRLIGEIVTKKITAKWITTLAHQFPAHETVLACVVPKLAPAFHRAFAGRLIEVGAGMPQACFGSGRDSEFRFDYPNPAEIGADRLAAAIAAHALGAYPTIIVSCGTATAFTVLDAKGRLCGGAIAPGLEAQLSALVSATAQLPSTVLRAPRSALGRSTEEAIRAGVMLNFLGGAKEILHRLSQALPGRRRPHILLTGGNARHLKGKLGLPVKLRPLLVFEGLHIIGSRLFTPVP